MAQLSNIKSVTVYINNAWYTGCKEVHNDGPVLYFTDKYGNKQTACGNWQVVNPGLVE